MPQIKPLMMCESSSCLLEGAAYVPVAVAHFELLNLDTVPTLWASVAQWFRYCKLLTFVIGVQILLEMKTVQKMN